MPKLGIMLFLILGLKIEMDEKIIIFTTTLKKNTSIWKFYSNIFRNMPKEIKIEIIPVRDLKTQSIVAKGIFKILSLFRVADFIRGAQCACKIGYNQYSIVINDNLQGWFAYKLIKKNENPKKLTIIRASAITSLRNLTTYGGLFGYLVGYLFYGFLLNFFERIAVELADRIVVVSRESYRNLREYYKISHEKIRIVRNAVELKKFFLLSKAEARKTLGLDTKKFYLLYVGRFTLEKGCKIIIELMKKLEKLYDDLELIVIGEVKYKEKLPRNIRILGEMENEKLILWYNAADLLIFPSLFEGDSLVCLEAAASGCPIVGSCTGGLWELKRVSRWSKRFIIDIAPPNKVLNKYIEAIRELRENRKVYKKMRFEFLKWGRKKDIMENSKIYTEIINELLNTVQ